MGHPYATIPDMIVAYRTQNLNKFPDVDVTDNVDPIVEEALNRASREMDGYFEQYGYVVPLAPSTPGRAKDLCVIIAYYWLAHMNPESKKANKSVVDNYKNAIAWLELLAEKKVSLGAGLDLETDTDALDVAQTSLVLDDQKMTDGNSVLGTDRNSLGGFAISDDESGAE